MTYYVLEYTGEDVGEDYGLFWLSADRSEDISLALKGISERYNIPLVRGEFVAERLKRVDELTIRLMGGPMMTARTIPFPILPDVSFTANVDNLGYLKEHIEAARRVDAGPLNRWFTGHRALDHVRYAFYPRRIIDAIQAYDFRQHRAKIAEEEELVAKDYARAERSGLISEAIFPDLNGSPKGRIISAKK